MISSQGLLRGEGEEGEEEGVERGGKITFKQDDSGMTKQGVIMYGLAVEKAYYVHVQCKLHF